jgi:hypothetical protein
MATAQELFNANTLAAQKDTFNLVGANTQVTCTTVQSITVPPYADMVLMGAVTQHLRFTLDGTDATANVGFTLRTDATSPYVQMLGRNITTIKACATVAGGVLNYQFACSKQYAA